MTTQDPSDPSTGVDEPGLGTSPSGQLEVATRVAGATATIHVRGELLQETAARFSDTVDGIADDATVVRLVVDLTGTAFMDSTGLGTLVNLRNRLLERGGTMSLIRPDDRVFRLFELTRLDTVFEFVDPE